MARVIPLARTRLPALLALLYGIASALWILLSDRIVQSIAQDSEHLTHLQSIKGWMFVLVSTGIVFALLAGMQRLRLRSDEAARDSAAARDQLRRIFDSVPGGIYVYCRDARGRYSFLYASKAFEEIIGATSEQVLADGARLAMYIHPEDLSMVEESVAASARTLSPWHAIFRICHPARGETWIEGRSTPIKQPDGAVLWYGILDDITGRRHFERALQESEARANLIIDTAPDAMMVVGSDGRLVRANARAARLFGYAMQDMLGLSVEALIPARFRTHHLEERARYARAASPRPMGEGRSLFAQRRDGSEFPVEVSLGPVLVAGEQQTVVMLTDISHRREAELKIERLAEIMKTSADLLALIDLDGRYQVANPAYARLHGTTPERIQGLRKEDVLTPDVLAQVRSAGKRALAGESSRVTVTATFADGQEHVLEMDYRPFLWNGEIAGAVTSGRDVTERTRSERALREAQTDLQAHRDHLERLVAARTAELRQQTRYLRALIDGFPFMVWLKDTHHRYLAVNRRIAEVLHLPPEDIPGRSDADLYPGEVAGRSRADDEEVMRARAPKLSEEPGERDGQRVWLETFKAPVLDEDGSVLGTVGYARDITERRAAERARDEALAEATRLAQARSAFLANMSHEIRTPLNAVLGLAQLGARGATSNQARNTFERIVDSGRLLLGIVNDVLDYAKIGADKLELAHEPFELGAAVDQAVDLVSLGILGKGLRFEVQEAADLPLACEGDALRLAQVLVNLLSNAMKFTHRGGILLRVAREGADLLFEVHDSGIGMTPEYLARLYTPFEQADASSTRRFGGTGLGLAITKHLVDAMGGSISAHSTQGSGSRFCVRIPARELRPAPAPLPVSIVLAGLAEADAQPLAQALCARGALVRSGTLQALDHEFDLAVCDATGLDEAELARIDAQTRGGRRIALVGMPQAADGDPLCYLARPLRARHVMLAATALAQPPTQPPLRARLAGLRVLAAEDNEVNRLVIEEMFDAEGGNLVQVENGVRALERLEADGPQHYDILLTDVQMPEMDGYETSRRIRARGWTLPILGLTAHAMPDERERCLAAGMSDYLAKPFDMDALVTAIRRLAPKAGSGADADRAHAPSSHDGGGGAVDWDALHQRFAGKQAFIDKLVVSALRTYADAPARLREVAGRRDFAALAFIAHGIRGTSANMCAPGVQRLARETESRARAQDAAALPLSLQLAVEVEALLAELAARRGASSIEARQDA